MQNICNVVVFCIKNTVVNMSFYKRIGEKAPQIVRKYFVNTNFFDFC